VGLGVRLGVRVAAEESEDVTDGVDVADMGDGDGEGDDGGVGAGDAVGAGVSAADGKPEPGEGVELSTKSLDWFVSSPAGLRSSE
jgi:hypothetical protein